MGCSKGNNQHKMHDSDVMQYGVWLQASPSKILWKTQGPKNNSGFSSFDKQHTIEEEALSVEIEQIAHLAEGWNEQGNHCVQMVNVDSNSQNSELVDNPAHPPSMIIGDSIYSTKSKEVNQNIPLKAENV